jgi:uncharacterized damage-inducible protein DinB
MLPRELLRDLLRHMEWADARVWAAVPADDPPDTHLRRLLIHTHAVQQGFLAVWRGTNVGAVFAHAEALSTLDTIRVWARSYYPEAAAFLDGVSDARLAEVIEMPWARQLTTMLGRPPSPTTVAETCFQVFSHSTYHRGQLNARLRELDVEPPLVDYIAWLWNGRPAAVWKP